MATQQFEAAKKLILHFTQKNCMNPESDIKGVMPGECRSLQPGSPTPVGRGATGPGRGVSTVLPRGCVRRFRHGWSAAGPGM